MRHLPPLFVLAGGLGTRLRPITQDRWPKPMVPVPVAGGSRPFLEFVLRAYRAAGGTAAVLCTGHLGDQVEAHFGAGARVGLALAYDRAEGLDTGARLRRALARFPTDTALVSCGDVLLEGAFPALGAALATRDLRRGALIALTRPGPEAGPANVVLDAFGLVLGHGPGIGGANWLEAGVLALSAGAFGAEDPPGPEFSLSGHLLPRLAREGRVGGVAVRGAFHDIGTPEGYHRFVDHAAGRVAAAWETAA